jgi:hypothetical protein
MASERQIAANRENSKHCTGPRTTAGLAKSSQNAIKTGIDAKSEIIRLENPADHEALTAAFHARFAPATPEELSLVDALIRFEWLSRRYACADTAIFESRFSQRDTRSLGQVLLEDSAKICRAVTAFNSVRRGFNATLKQLRQEQANRPQSLETTAGEFHQSLEISLPASPEIPAEPAKTKLLNSELVSFLEFPNAEPEPVPTTAPEPGKTAAPPEPDSETPPIAA